MRRLLLIAVLFFGGIAAFFAAERAASHWCLKLTTRPSDDLEWLRLEFRLSDPELAAVRQLHEGYLPRCEDFCERIAAKKLELQRTVSGGTNSSVRVEQQLVELGTLRAQCQAGMLEHFKQVAQVMPVEQGRRYLAEMQRLTLGFHEQIERSMTPAASAPHGHH
jgi:hypothetical protein